MTANYILTITNDSDPQDQYYYDNAVEAVHAFDKCVDYGTARSHRSVTLFESKTEKLHTKYFQVP